MAIKNGKFGRKNIFTLTPYWTRNDLYCLDTSEESRTALWLHEDVKRINIYWSCCQKSRRMKSCVGFKLAAPAGYTWNCSLWACHDGMLDVFVGSAEVVVSTLCGHFSPECDGLRASRDHESVTSFSFFYFYALAAAGQLAGDGTVTIIASCPRLKSWQISLFLPHSWEVAWKRTDNKERKKEKRVLVVTVSDQRPLCFPTMHLASHYYRKDKLQFPHFIISPFLLVAF